MAHKIIPPPELESGGPDLQNHIEVALKLLQEVSNAAHS